MTVTLATAVPATVALVIDVLCRPHTATQSPHDLHIWQMHCNTRITSLTIAHFFLLMPAGKSGIDVSFLGSQTGQ